MNTSQNTTTSTPSARLSSMDTSGFFYVDGIPTKGCWIDLSEVTSWEDINEQLGAYLGIDPASIDEVLCADVEGIARHFYSSNCDGFSMNAWTDFRDELEASYLDVEIVEAYLDNMGAYGGVDISTIEESYYGEFDSFEDFVYQFVEDTCILDGLDDSIRGYFDYEKYGRDLSHDYFESNGYIFRNC